MQARLNLTLVAILVVIGSGTVGSLAAPLAKPLSQEEVLKAAQRIDALLEADLAKKKLSPLPLISDDVFVRRTYLSIVGRIPTPQEALSFLDDDTTTKRATLIDALTRSPGYESHAFNYYADLFRLQTNLEQHGLGWHVYLRKSIAENKPYDTLVHEMLSSDGHVARDPAAAYYLRDRGMLLDNVSNTMQVFLGHQIGCAQCHDHPFDTWTQMEYYELAAFSGGMEFRSREARTAVTKAVKELRGNQKQPFSKRKSKKARQQQAMAGRKINGQFRNLFRYFRRNEITTNENKNLTLPDDYKYEDGEPGEVVNPSTIFGHKLKDVPPAERRKEFATWVTSGNDYFAKVIANRLWDRTFGRGLVEPMDDWSNNSAASHPEVLDTLAKLMHDLGYQTREFERVLYHTKLFQREVTATETPRGFGHTFVGPHLRRLSAEQMYDSLLVLNFGNVDDNINVSLEKKWDEFREGTLDILESTPDELIAYSKKANQAEKERLAYQRESRAIQTKIAAANKKGNYKAAGEARREMVKLRRKIRDQREGMQAFARRSGGGTRASLNMRASEHPTPFKGGHLVRLFGGSDRNTPESSHTQATTPQALSLLNGQIASSTERRRSKIFAALGEITSPETRLEYLFLAFYGAKPTAAETEELLPIARDREDIFSLARAMLTTKRFLFVQ